MSKRKRAGAVKTYKFKGQADANGNRAIFTRIPEKFFLLLEAEAKRERRSMSQQAALILEHYAERQAGQQPKETSA